MANLHVHMYILLINSAKIRTTFTQSFARLNGFTSKYEQQNTLTMYELYIVNTINNYTDNLPITYVSIFQHSIITFITAINTNV